MSVEQALIARARPHMLAVRAQAAIANEAGKGCSAQISPVPVALEPCYRFISQVSDLLAGENEKEIVAETPPAADQICRLPVWISPQERFSWLKSELFLKQLQTVSHRVCIELVGNKSQLQMRFVAHREDLPILQTAFLSQHAHCELSTGSDDPFLRIDAAPWEDLLFVDFFPPPPYSHLLTRPEELKITTFLSLVTALMEIEPPAKGFYQTVFQPVTPEHDWHRNVQLLLDLEYALKLHTGIQTPQRFLQQAPSGDLRQMAWELENKAHNDKPFYFAAVRLGVISGGERGPQYRKALSTFASLFQHGGRPLNSITEMEYKSAVSSNDIMNMFVLGATYRSGFLVNSSELAGFVHVPQADILECRSPSLCVLETLPVRNDCLLSGTPLGTCDYAGTAQHVCIPLWLRTRSTHIIGKPDQGKSTVMCHMILDDIEKGMGVAVIDPHGDLIEDVLDLIRTKDVERTIYFDPGRPDYVPLWNPMARTPGQSKSCTADNLVAAFKTVVTGWGDRLEHLLRNAIYGLLQLPDCSLFDVANLLRKKTAESKRLQKEILKVVDNESAYQFWKNDFHTYSSDALGPPMHKLSKLLLSDRSSLMLSQPENRIDFREIMDTGKILLINLSNVGPEEREILGCFFLSFLHLTALGRSPLLKAERRPYHIHVDEVHRFITEALEDLIAETRKFKVSLNLAHQYLSQFGTKKIDALSSVGTTIVMNIDTKDARYLTKDFRMLVTYKDLIGLQKGEAIARIGTDIVRFKTLGPLEQSGKNNRAEILEHSFKRYYKPADAVRNSIRQKARPYEVGIHPLTDLVEGDSDEFEYDEF